MKRIMVLIITFVICCFSFNVFASTNYQVRTEDNLGVPSYIQVTDENKDSILSTPLVDSSEKVYDFADKFNDSEENDLYDKILTFTDKYSMDMVIVTIDENPKNSALAYAQDFYDYNTFGIGDTHNGILILFDFATRNVQIVTTGSAIKMYSDIRIDIILDNVFKYMDGDYYKAANEFISSASSYADIGFPNDDGSEPKPTGIAKLNVLPWTGILIFTFVTTIIIMIVMVASNKMVRKATSSRQFLREDSVKINLIKETFLGTSVTKTKRVNNSNSGGGHSGGSSTSTGSSGVSHGGGGRSF